MLQEFYLVALDVFRKNPYPKDRSERTAWLSLLTTEDLEDAGKMIEEYPEYPWIREIYEEIAMLRQRPEEVLGMFSEALKILDQNTVTYMIEELEKELEVKAASIEEKNAQLKEKNAEIAELRRQLALQGNE